MKVGISDIVKIDGASLNIEFNQVIPGLNSTVSDYVIENPVIFSGHLTNISGILKLEGQIKAEYIAKCYRCLKGIESHLSIEVEEEFVNKDPNTANDEGYTYEANYVEIDKVLKDNIILNLPMKLLCTSDCKGLCPRCGSDLNEKVCECTDKEMDSRMEDLKKFFKN